MTSKHHRSEDDDMWQDEVDGTILAIQYNMHIIGCGSSAFVNLSSLSHSCGGLVRISCIM